MMKFDMVSEDGATWREAEAGDMQNESLHRLFADGQLVIPAAVAEILSDALSGR